MSRCITLLATTVVVWVASSVWTGARAQWTAAVQVPHAAFVIEGAPSALVHASPSFDPSKPLRIVVFLHGYMACTAMLMGEGPVRCTPSSPAVPGRTLAREHDASGSSSLLIVPQLAFMQRTGKAGCFAERGCFRAFLQEVLAALPKERVPKAKSLADVEGVTLIAHSAGYEATVAILQHGQIDALVRDVVLCDALYAKADAFLAWIASNRSARLLSLHLRGGRPAGNSAKLLRAAQRRLGAQYVTRFAGDLDTPAFATALKGKRVITARVNVAHRDVATRYFASVLRAL